MTKRFRIADVPVADTWAALEKLVAEGKIRSIGISNFTVQATKDLLKTAKIPPAVNQIEAHPYLLQPDLHQFLKDNVSPVDINAVRKDRRLFITSDTLYRTFSRWLIARSETTSTVSHGTQISSLVIWLALPTDDPA